jgi:ABC-type multidrug transport system fused ATPase/permease subunit
MRSKGNVCAKATVLGGKHERRFAAQVRGDIEFRDVRFRHAGRSAWTLDGVSFTVAAGSTVALVGPSGSGAPLAPSSEARHTSAQ